MQRFPPLVESANISTLTAAAERRLRAHFVVTHDDEDDDAAASAAAPRSGLRGRLRPALGARGAAFAAARRGGGASPLQPPSTSPLTSASRPVREALVGLLQAMQSLDMELYAWVKAEQARGRWRPELCLA